MRAIAIAVLACACARETPAITSCADRLGGVWRAPAGAETTGEWSLIDRGAALEAYPLFDDSRSADPAVVAAPRVIDLHRDREELGGELVRRYMRGSDSCTTKVPVHVLSCSTMTLELVLADPAPPIGFAPCAWSARNNPSRREKWQRAR